MQVGSGHGNFPDAISLWKQIFASPWASVLCNRGKMARASAAFVTAPAGARANDTLCNFRFSLF